jgi:DNA-binding NtrC family response regulator
MQVKLLRVLQEREVRRVGENQGRKVNVRVLAATNRDLVEEIRAARFRQDLYYRLRVVELRVPPLRERRDDIPLLARTFLAASAERGGRKGLSFSPAAAQQLLRHDWPGNVRELENAVERASVLAPRDRIDVEDLPDDIRAMAAQSGSGSPCSLAEVERKHILAVLGASDGNQAKAAATLGIGTATLYRKLKEYGAEPGLAASRCSRVRP